MSSRNRIEILSRIALFEDLSKQKGALEKLSDLFVERNFKKGDHILDEGRVGTELYVLISGEVAVLKTTPDGERYPVARLTDTQSVFFGEGGLLEDEARSASIYADTDCLCLMLDRKHFDSYCFENPSWALPVIRKVAQKVHSRLRKANQDMMLLYNALVGEIRGR
jgi:CRP/FNR family cyclic AMP-dependent transcriptional regulator